MSFKGEWVEAAKKELGGKDPYEVLSKSWNEFTILPYYRANDSHFNQQIIFGSRANTFNGPNSWFNLPEVSVSNVNKANSVALDHLQCGADGVFFKVQPNLHPETLLNKFKPEFCFLGFEPESNEISFFDGLTQMVAPTSLNGAIIWKGDANWLSLANLFKGYNSFRCLGITEDGETPFEQIFSCLRKALHIADQLTDYAFPVQHVFGQLAFSINASPNFFGDAVKVRTLRILLQRFAEAYGLKDSVSFIRVKVNLETQKIYEPHGDLLGNGIAAIAAVASSADAITIVPNDQLSDLHSRTARNVSVLLKEESKLDKVIDPFAGSYFVESMTNSLVEKVWSKLIQGK
jgi:methylmalonyl-CoA mutase